jgi:S-(hydroxymethyl)glutathione dehydrogenase/alcohol dehydrogenase
MKARAAVLWEQPGRWEVEEVELDGPGYGEVLVEMAATGICHSDAHFVTGDVPLDHLPFCAGHEGCGVVREVGPGVRRLAEGDHIVTTFVPSCGQCRWCAAGMQHLCDSGALVMKGAQLDGTFRMHSRGQDVATAGMLGAFADWQVLDELSCIRIDKSLPMASACLVGCGVPTGTGSAIRAAQVRPGDVVIVMGVGGVGMNAVQGAAQAGANHVIAVDPVEWKQEAAKTFGATNAFSDMADATEFARSLTNGQGADSAIVTVGVLNGDHVGKAFAAIRKAGTVVVTSQGAPDAVGMPVNLFEISMYQKRIQGVMYGCASPRETVPALLNQYVAGTLKLDELVTRTYSLEQINDGFGDMDAGRNIRGVVEFSQ